MNLFRFLSFVGLLSMAYPLTASATADPTEVGILNAYRSENCPPEEIQKNLEPDEDTVIPGKAKFEGLENWTVDQITENYRKILARAIDPFIARGDLWASTHRTCVVMVSQKSPNIHSSSNGFILIDPNTWIQINQSIQSMSKKTDSSLMINFVLLHEMAHQMQYWESNLFRDDETKKRIELTADCTGAALLNLSYGRSLPLILRNSMLDGVFDAAFSIGDNNSEEPSHHGTPAERRTAARAGVTQIDNYLTRHLNEKNLTLKSILDTCSLITAGAF
ncbi:hypothetical protein WDW37_00520 [Bdellovibrionota bacterium FG-1]